MNKEEARQILDSYWNYCDVLALAVAQTKSEKFDANPAKWHQLVSDFKDKTRDTAPELLKGVFFDRRPGSFPYSDQVEQFFFVMGLAEQVTISSPVYDEYEMSEKAKKSIVGGKSPQLNQYADIIAEFAKTMDQTLGRC